MINKKSNNDDVIRSLYSHEDSIFCIMVTSIIIILIGVMPSVFLNEINPWLIIIPWVIVGIIVYLLHFFASKTYCPNCKKFVHPIISEHRCEIHYKGKHEKIKKLYSNSLKNEFKQIDNIIDIFSKHKVFKNDGEKEILKRNIKSLKLFEYFEDYKYCMVAMGSIIEFLLIRYCKSNKISPESFTDHLGNTLPANKKQFANYVQAAIKNNILNQKYSWFIVQNNLRNFRNYVHIRKEVKEEQIDIKWYESIKPAFEKIVESFK